MSPNDLSGKVAIVSGASRGIGESIARAYAGAGASVVVSSRKAENIMPLAEALNKEFPGNAMGVKAHAGRREDTLRLVGQTVQRFGRIDIAVNNAATNPHFGPILTAEESHWD